MYNFIFIIDWKLGSELFLCYTRIAILPLYCIVLSCLGLDLGKLDYPDKDRLVYIPLYISPTFLAYLVD